MASTRAVLLLLIVLAVPVTARPAPPPAAPAPAARARAESLHRRARERLARSTIESRRSSIQDLEQATLLDPRNAGAQLLLARLYLQCGYLKLSQQRFEAVTRLVPEDADGRIGLAQIWRRDYLKYLETRSLDRAIENYAAAAHSQPATTEAWLGLAPLYVERGDVPAALDAATRATQADPGRPEAVLALAQMSYRSGRVRAADSLFRLVIPRLPRLARARFDDISPVASASDTIELHRLAPPEQRSFVDRFWRDADPDLASTENEAQLEYWSRVAQAYFLFFDAKRKEWDERGEIYVRYGPPQRVEYNPLADALPDPHGDGRFGGDVVRFVNTLFPVNVLMWKYPRLGMNVRLEDRTLSEYYLLPQALEGDPDPYPNPDSVAAQGGDVALAGGRGVFPKFAPGVRPIPIDGQVARFQGTAGTRVVANVEARGGPGESLWGEWVVRDSTLREVARERRELGPSACDPAAMRVADFAGELPPGRYSIGLTVQGDSARRGTLRRDIELARDDGALAVSDLVVSCGTPAPGAGPGVRIAPNAAGRVLPGAPVTAYFEVYHLRTDDGGEARFEYDCIVRSAEKDSRVWLKRLFQPRTRIPDVATRREGTNIGPLRRQFVSVPVPALPPGRYRLEVVVRDLMSGEEAVATAPFEKVAG